MVKLLRFAHGSYAKLTVVISESCRAKKYRIT